MTEELTVAQKLQALFHLQSIDSKIDEIRVVKGELPMELKDLEDEIEGLQTRITNSDSTIKSLENDITKLKNTAKDCETMISKYEKQQENVKNNREFEALTKEIEMQRLEIQLCEKRQKDARTKISDNEGKREITQNRLNVKQKEHAAKEVELAKIIAETVAEELEITADIDKARLPVEERLLMSYDKIRKAYRNGMAVVKVERNSCGGCFSKVPAQLQVEIAQRRKIIVCENCGRVLVDENIDNPDYVPSQPMEAY